MLHAPLLHERYAIQRTLAQGDVATTYLAVDLTSQQECAIKRLAFPKTKDWQAEELFQHEAAILKRLDHPRIPAYIDFFIQGAEDEIEMYLVQEYVEGQSLEQLVQQQHKFTETEILTIALDIAGILEYLHTLSPPILHQDIKPSNIIVSPDHRAYLIDFDSVKNSMVLEHIKFSDMATISETYEYVPVEQFKGQPIPASDIYALGMSLVYALSHTPPADIEKRGESINFQPYVKVSIPCARVLEKMIALEPSHRYQTAARLIHDLKLLQSKKRTASVRLASTQTPARTFFVIIALLIAALLGFRVFSPPSPSTQHYSTTVPVAMSPEMPPLPNTNPDPRLAADTTPTYTVQGELLFAGQPMTQFTTAPPVFRFFNRDTKQQETPQIEYGDQGQFQAQGISAGHFYVSAEIDANPNNPNRFPGDYIKWGLTLESPSTSRLSIDMITLIHLQAPQDNTRQLHPTNSACNEFATFDSPVHFAWVPLGQDIRYHYQIGTVNCTTHVFHPGNIADAQTTQTEITLDLPPNASDEKYSFHIFAEKDGQQIGRLYIHKPQGSTWNYEFRISD